jgi:3-phenylpropionate/trans-cinnamate dioxygenase ferredoxin component
MPTFQVGALADIPPGAGRAFDVDGHRIAIFRVDDELFAIDDTCSHAEASLSAGEFDPDEYCVECPLHGSIFDVRSGVPRTFPAFEPVQTYRVFVEGQQVFVEYPA